LKSPRHRIRARAQDYPKNSKAVRDDRIFRQLTEMPRGNELKEVKLAERGGQMTKKIDVEVAYPGIDLRVPKGRAGFAHADGRPLAAAK
jgi:hypothetical protein